MTSASPPAVAAFPRTVSSIAVAFGGMAMLFVFASWLLVSYPIGSTVSGYFYGIDSPRKVDLLVSPRNGTFIDPHPSSDAVNIGPPSGPKSRISDSSSSFVVDENVLMKLENSSEPKSSLPVPTDTNSLSTSDTVKEPDQKLTHEEGARFVQISSNVSASESTMGSIDHGSGDAKPNNDSDVSRSEPKSNSSLPSSNVREADDPRQKTSSEPVCDLYHGSWVYDPLGPSYTNNTCPVLTQMQNCQGNGRPDKEYENWRWKPFQCDLPRFDAKKFLNLMRGKTLAFIGDSVARNQMESMLCLLWQVEVPVNRGSRKMQRWYFKSSSVMIARMWSSWLVHQFSKAFDYAPQGVVKLQLDAPDERIMELLPKFDVVVLSSGHWFAKQSVYVLNNEIVGGQLWWPDKSKPMKVNNVEAFGISVDTILSAIAMHPNYTGLAIVRTFSPDHYEGGAWNTGGSCTGKIKPLALGHLVKNGFTEIMHDKQVMGFNRAMKKAADKSKLKLMDITEAFGYRHDGHPGPYRNPNPNKITKRGPDGRPPPQDCLHWCMPGPVDTWNELVLEIIRREFEGKQRHPS